MGTEILVFEVDGRRFGLPSVKVQEVVRAVTLTPVPSAPALVEGVVNLRGRVVPVVDVRRLFRLPARAIQHTDHLIVVRLSPRLLILRVDRALDLVHLDTVDVEPSESVIPAVEGVSAISRTSLGIVYVIEPEIMLSQVDSVAVDLALASAETLGGASS